VSRGARRRSPTAGPLWDPSGLEFPSGPPQKNFPCKPLKIREVFVIAVKGAISNLIIENFEVFPGILLDGGVYKENAVG